MATKVKQSHGGSLIKLAKGETNNPNGRPRKFVTALKSDGYKLSEINDTISVLIAMNLEELKTVFVDPKATILEKTIAGALRKSLEKGSLFSLETLLTRVHGRPKETAEIQNDGKIEIVFVNGKSIQ